MNNLDVLTGDLPDRALAEPVESVTPASFVEFYRDSYGRMVRLAYLLTGSVETAQDLVQDAFVAPIDGGRPWPARRRTSSERWSTRACRTGAAGGESEQP